MSEVIKGQRHYDKRHHPSKAILRVNPTDSRLLPRPVTSEAHWSSGTAKKGIPGLGKLRMKLR
jgi:hypothetical protein